MTYEEAKKDILNIYIRSGKSDKVLCGEALNMSIKAINKQILKKPIITIHKYIQEETRKEGEYHLTHCPYCFENRDIGYFESLLDKGVKHCHRCGQAIDWNDHPTEKGGEE